MKNLVVMCYAMLCGLAWCAALPQDKYTTRYDYIDIDQVLQNDRLFHSYVNCLLNDEGCTPDANELKAVLSEALNSECSKCSANQKQKAEKAFVYVYNNKKDVFDKLAQKFDPNGVLRRKYSRYAEERGIQFS